MSWVSNLVMQGGEDGYYTDDRMAHIISGFVRLIRTAPSPCRLENASRKATSAFFDAGANRYLLRHETADEAHYKALHPQNLRCPQEAVSILGSRRPAFRWVPVSWLALPGQTARHLAKDLLFLKELGPQMVGIGPFIRHQDTPFAKYESGSMEQTLLMMIGILRLMFPNILIQQPPRWEPFIRLAGKRELAGANVVMPNLSP